jgi:hypothetical protein
LSRDESLEIAGPIEWPRRILGAAIEDGPLCVHLDGFPGCVLRSRGDDTAMARQARHQHDHEQGAFHVDLPDLQVRHLGQELGSA